MSTKESLKAQMHDFDRKILLNHTRQGEITFVRNGTRDSALAMNALRSEMKGLQVGRAQIQAEIITLRMLLVEPSSTATRNC
jgi:hypothetical protein